MVPMGDFWVKAILSSTNPSPVPSTTSTISNDENLDKGFEYDCSTQTNFSTMPMFWNPSLVQQMLALYQIQQQQLQFSSKFTPQTLFPENIDLKDPSLVTPSRKRQLASEPKKTKLRKLHEDTVTSSPVSGMFIKKETDVKCVEELQKEADMLDETAAYVEVTEESRQKIDEIPNVIGDCICRLCKVKYDDVFKLAQHKCPRIAHEEYKCPDCDKVFSCPANLASHRRWHKPRNEFGASSPPTQSVVSCPTCFNSFPSKKMLKLHSTTCQRSPLQDLLSRVIPTM
ncbi:hypothetical protein GCK72_017973 [Caenorhabditis remanei]|uniref:C2H2-type domain-containing protein n=1 Tax=Caenorhabditis remanei TaxID=31234 RepID=A0A6A5GAB8_CAERE|nr:hypothetical protein GCK72_017973 [Caenorhabditis remanei]KAF1751419.1 hypothetical protein GCK72_017973 [Caenorhabditis remanei]